MTNFQKKTLKNVTKAAGIAIATVAATFGVIVLMAYSIYTCIITVGAIGIGLVVRYFIFPLIKDWKLRGKLTEDEYGIYTYYKERCGYISKETIIKELAHWNNITMKQVQEIIAKAEGSPTEN